MRALFRFFQIVLGAAAHHRILKIDILLQHILQRHHLGHAAVQRQHNNAHCVLQLRITVQLIQHNLRVGLALELDDNAHALAVRFIVQV